MQASLVLSAWQALDSCRMLGVRPMPVQKGRPIMVPYAGPIPWTAIEQYGRFRGLGREAIALLAEVIARLDFERSEREASELRSKK